jgi:diamine N-acetyltransferase
MEQIIEKIKAEGATTLLLNVNRDNSAKTFYEKLGFAVLKVEDIDIGNGFFMNDYIMEKKISPPHTPLSV